MPSGNLRKLKKNYFYIFNTSQNYLRMRQRKRQRRNPVPSQPAYNSKDEINTNNYPYYPTIPIQYISNRQQQMLDKHKIKKDEPFDVTGGDCIPEEKQPPFPLFNLVQKPGENFYRIDEKQWQYEQQQNEKQQEQQNEKQQEQQKLYQENTEKINDQLSTISANDITIGQQAHTMYSQNETIQNGVAHIQQQLYVYNNNQSIIGHQDYTYKNNAFYITKQEENLEVLKYQVQEYEEQIEQLTQEIESQQQQISYHGSMLSAFNTMIRNPAYFTQLISMSFTQDGLNPV